MICDISHNYLNETKSSFMKEIGILISHLKNNEKSEKNMVLDPVLKQSSFRNTMKD